MKDENERDEEKTKLIVIIANELNKVLVNSVEKNVKEKLFKSDKFNIYINVLTCVMANSLLSLNKLDREPYINCIFEHIKKYVECNAED